MAEQTQIPPRGDVSATFSIQTEERTPGTSLAQRALAMATGLADRQPERHGAASDCPNGPAGAEAQSNTASDGAAPDDFEPYIKIEIRVSACEDSQGIEVPLGYYHRGKWCPYLLVPTEEGLWMEPDDVASWLASEADLGSPYFDSGEAETMVDETMKRCLALARASAAESNRVAASRALTND